MGYTAWFAPSASLFDPLHHLSYSYSCPCPSLSPLALPMSAATAVRRPNYGSTTMQASTSQQQHHQHQHQQHHHHQQHPYPTPVTSASTMNGGGSARSSVAAALPPIAHPRYPARTAGESWSLQRDGERTVIVIEDTPPPGASASSSTAYNTRPAAGYPAAAGTAKRAKYNGSSSSSAATATATGTVTANGLPLPSNAYVQPAPAPLPRVYPPSGSSYQVNNAIAGPSAYSNLSFPPNNPAPPQASSSSNARKVSNQKRKYNEVNEPATANDRLYASSRDKAPLPCDDKDGHYIIRPDDELGDTRRYKIIKLLGQGTFGKVVEAWDRDTKCLVAVKVIRAIQKYRDASRVEIKVLNLLRDRDPSNINKCIHLLDCFDHRNHICIVTRLLSCSVFDFLKDNNYLPFPAAHIQSFAKQLLTSVSFLHDLRLIHTDLKPENILLVDSDYTNIPQQPTKAAPTVKVKRILKNSSIHLIDFGSATFEEEYHANVVSTRHYRAPEIILGMGWSYPCDVWSIGCILVEFFTGEALFQTHENLEHLAMMEVVFGRVPDGKWGRAANRAKPEYFTQGPRVNYPTPTTTRQSKKYVRAMKPLEALIPPNNIVTSRFLDLLSHLLKWNPDERYTVKDALKHPFFALKIDDDEVALANRMR